RGSMKTGPCSTTSTPSPGWPRTARYWRLRKGPSEASIEPAGLTLFCGERLHRLRKNSTLHLILGGAALQRVRENYSFAPLGLHDLPFLPTAYALGCIFLPLLGSK